MKDSATSRAVSLRFRIDAIAGIYNTLYNYLYLVKQKKPGLLISRSAMKMMFFH
jgi:hypothetical protein